MSQQSTKTLKQNCYAHTVFERRDLRQSKLYNVHITVAPLCYRWGAP